jgi:hypothetical protein
MRRNRMNWLNLIIINRSVFKLILISTNKISRLNSIRQTKIIIINLRYSNQQRANKPFSRINQTLQITPTQKSKTQIITKNPGPSF